MKNLILEKRKNKNEIDENDVKKHYYGRDSEVF